ncbi:MAG: LIC_13387 family protein [Terracidiphilus sp.]
MKPVIFLRVASILTLIHAVLHTIGGVFGDIGPGAASIAVAAMKANTFPLMGHTRSFWDFYRGMGIGVSISLTMEGTALWLLGSVATRDATRLRPTLATFAVGYLALSVNSYTNFFLGPVIAEILIAACLIFAIFTAKPQATAQFVG